jgi:hypothetical protein
MVFKPRNVKYPWRKWANGRWHKLVHGKDFDTGIEIFRTNACQWAKRNGYTVETRRQSDGKTLAVRFRPSSI